MILTDFLVIGGGVVGLNIARELKRKFPRSKTVLLEKEEECGKHASGRNSGVLHAGFYYTANSLKARFSRAGNERLTAYCLEKKIPLNRCGKLVVAKDASELASLDELLRRGRANGVLLEEVTAEQARAIEPRALTYERAIFSPTTSSVNPAQVMQSMKEDALREGVEIHCGTAFTGRQGDTVLTSREPYQAGYVVNAAGLYADRVARAYGFSEHYRILPFKGLYLYSDQPAGWLRVHVYPVPDLRNPFLGVHFTVTAEGKVKIGPTAIPAFWREQYHGLQNFHLPEFMDVTLREMGLLFFSGFDFKRLALEEIRKYSRRRIVSLASQLVQGVERRDYHHWGVPGIRAQLMHTKTKKLEMDFVLEGDAKSLHVLNAVSPGFTCAIPFAEHVCENVKELMG